MIIQYIFYAVSINRNIEASSLVKMSKGKERRSETALTSLEGNIIAAGCTFIF